MTYDSWKTTDPAMEQAGRGESMDVLVACETSGAVRTAFRERGHDAWSCDLLPSDDGSDYHIQGDALEVIARRPWGIVIAHPPCTHLAVSGARWFKDKIPEQKAALAFVRDTMDAMDTHSQAWALENPVSIISTRIRTASQYIQPWQFGHGETTKTGLWLHNLPLLTPTHIVEGREQKIWKMGPSEDRWKERSKTYTGIARVMAHQWGG